jgi:ATP-dependent Clp protease ATP-binding subunit ClpX
MDNDTLVILYKRELLTEDNDSINEDNKKLETINEGKKVNQYVLSPIEVVDGSIIDVDGIKVFYSSDNKYELKMIDEIKGLNDEFSYAFPMDVEGCDDDYVDETIECIKNDELFNTYLLQTYDIKEKEMSNVYAYNKYSSKVLALINPLNYDDSLSAIIYDITDYAKTISDKQILILRPGDVEYLEKEKEEKEKEELKYAITPHKAVKYSNNYVYADELYDEIRKNVISQDEQIKAISTIFAKNQRIDNPYMKTNFILCGPTGCGKTEIFRQLAKIANVPMTIEDSSEFTAAGYVGRTVTDILSTLYDAADGDLKKAENGIILMDEIDKKSSPSKDMEVNKGAVIQALLKMIEGHIYPINVGKKQIYFDTSRVTFAFSGAFSDIEKFSKDYCEKQLGFGNTQLVTKLDKTKIYNTQTLKNYGLMPEFIGRNKIIVMNDLDNVEDLETILTTSNLSYLKLYSEYLKSLSIAFEYDNDVIRAIAERALLEKTGARSLSSITESALEVADYYITSKNASKYKLLKITPKTIEDNTNFILR